MVDLLTVVLNNDVGSAEVQESSNQIICFKQVLHHCHQFFFSFFTVDEVFVLCDYCKPFFELLFSVLFAHVLCELCIVTSVQINHFFLFLIFIRTLIVLILFHWWLFWTDLIVPIFILCTMWTYGCLWTRLVLFLIWLLLQILLQVLNVTHILIIEEFLTLILFVVSLRWFVLVYVQVLHLLPCLFLLFLFPHLRQYLILYFLLSLSLLLFSLFFCFSFLFLFIFFKSILESFKDVVVMQQSMRKLILEIIIV